MEHLAINMNTFGNKEKHQNKHRNLATGVLVDRGDKVYCGKQIAAP